MHASSVLRKTPLLILLLCIVAAIAPFGISATHADRDAIAASSQTSGTPGFHTNAVIPADVSSPTATATVTGTPLSNILAITPNPVAAGQNTVVSGCGFTAGENVTVALSTSGGSNGIVANTSASFQAGTTGCINTSYTIPASVSAGSYFVLAVGTTSFRGLSAVLTVTGVNNTLTITPSTSAANGHITVSGCGFSNGETVTVSLATGTASSTIIPNTNANTVVVNGCISISYTIPANVLNGGYTVLAIGQSSGVVRSAPVIVGANALTVTPNVAPAGGTVVVTGCGFTANESVAVSLAAGTTTNTIIGGTTLNVTAQPTGCITTPLTLPSVTNGTYSILAIGQTSTITILGALTVGTVTVTPTATVTTTSSPVGTPSVPSTPGTIPFPSVTVPATVTPGALATVGSGQTITYFADGYTGTAAKNGKVNFQEHLYLYNSGSQASTVTTTYYVSDSTTKKTSTVVKTDSLAAGATTVRSVNSDVGNDVQVSAQVQATAGVVAEVQISRTSANNATLDSDSSLGATAPSQTWLFAEGYTGATLQEYLTLFNPSTNPAHAQVQYLPSDGASPAPQPITVPAGSQVTINVRSAYNGLVARGSRNIGIRVTSDQAILADRAMYWGDGDGSAKYGYSLRAGSTAGQSTQYFAFLPTAKGSQSFVTVLNPNSTSVTLSLRLMDSKGGSLRTAMATVGANQRYTFVLPTLLQGDHGALTGVLTSSGPVVAEAGVYFNGSPNVGQHPGLVLPATGGNAVGARASVAAGGAVLYAYNPKGIAARLQVSVSNGSATPSVVFDSTLAGNTQQAITLPAGTDPRGILVRASGPVTTVLVNGGDGSTTAYGGSLN